MNLTPTIKENNGNRKFYITPIGVNVKFEEENTLFIQESITKCSMKKEKVHEFSRLSGFRRELTRMGQQVLVSSF